MNTQSANQKPPQEDIEARIRTIRTLWIAMVLSVINFFVFLFIVGRPENVTPNNTLSITLLAIALLTTLISFPIKNRLLARGVEQQQVLLVQQGYVVAWALTEVAALLGVLDFFQTSNPYFYVLFVIAVCGMLLHFPRREHVLNAAFKRSLW